MSLELGSNQRIVDAIVQNNGLTAVQLQSMYAELKGETEQLYFLARLIQNGAEPYVQDGRLCIKNPPSFKNYKWGVGRNKFALNKAKQMLTILGV